MNLFKHRQFKQDIIIWAIRWYLKYGISYRNLEEMLQEKGVYLDHSTINRWVVFYAPKLSAIKVKGKWTYLYRAVNKEGETIDFYLSPSRDGESSEHFFVNHFKD